jgi:DNA/RNA endonuclease YhcR with UshA esterase domain
VSYPGWKEGDTLLFEKRDSFPGEYSNMEMIRAGSNVAFQYVVESKSGVGFLYNLYRMRSTFNIKKETVFDAPSCLFLGKEDESRNILLYENVTLHLTYGYCQNPRTLTIAEAKTLNTQDIAIDRVDEKSLLTDPLKITGTVLGGNLAASPDLVFTVHDGNVGFGVYAKSKDTFKPVNDYITRKGDVVEVYGFVTQFNGLARIDADYIVVQSTNSALPQPRIVTGLNEGTESQLVRVNDVYISDCNGWLTSDTSISGFAVIAKTETDNVYSLYIDKYVDLFHAPCPRGNFDVVGIGTQFDTTRPYTSGYRLAPRSAEDILPRPVPSQ